MDTVTISPKQQVVIPEGIRERFELHPGQKVEAILYDRRIELVPVRLISEVRGFLPGLDSDVPRARTTEYERGRFVRMDRVLWTRRLAGDGLTLGAYAE